MRAKVPSFTSVIVIIIALNHSFMGSATLQRFAEFALLRRRPSRHKLPWNL